ncbi:endonuclease/exonuclease/phosphatase family protein [Solwaraspora sp. WMMB335]|uniref:endonuclease/exonuclease/phosphatase family protein n=1 Tax=Solwaraspora sp. WMMB335 TaxID=3404118 RepID=UPI003B936404
MRLRVLSYNIHGQRDARRALAEVVREIAPDVAILQEGPRRLRWRHRCAALADDFGMVVGGGGLPALGNLLLTTLRVRVRRTWSIQFPLTPGRHLRGAAFARCTVGSADFVIAGAHLSTDAAERPDQARRLHQACQGLDDPLIMGMDVNETATAGGAAWPVVAGGLIDTAAVTGHGRTATFPCHDPRQRIDAIFVDPRLVVTAYQVVDTAAARRASDHLPIVTDLVLPAGDPPAGDPPAGDPPADATSARGLDKRGG